ncbi:MAG: hypothetical protein PHX88_11080 [Methanoculleus horonobensis]|uniref:hypothetical protein n=1 Tax=Methanoculleus sp. TaxID=90427 RepID=UPI002A2D5170|nr:hypothetical protein [Methanoculleus horonobensis]MDD3856437.1 hypothetical protein [Methanoculleus sp.]HOI60929.1 hypothetical protein [Methanoculleus sp.]
MRPIILVLLLIAVAGFAGTEVINVSLPDRDAPEAVLGTAESMWGFVEWLLQVADDLLSLVRDVLGYLEVGGEYVERLMGAMDSGKDLVNRMLEEGAPSRGL